MENAPAVMMQALASISSLLWPRKTLRSQSTMTAPAKILNPMGRPRMPTPTGSWPYTLKAWVGQKSRTEKKLAPEMKVMTRVSMRMRGACFRRAGNIGNLANLASQTQKATSMKKPMKSGARTWAVFHEY